MGFNGVVVLVSALISLPSLQGLAYDKCDSNFEKVSCYTDSTSNRALPTLLLTGRDPGSPVFDGHRIDWHNYTGYISGLACRCCAMAREKGYKFFGLQNNGECWGGNDDYAKHGKADPSKCIPDYEKSCDDSNDAVCVGSANVNYVYQLKEAEVKKCKGAGDPLTTALGMEDGRIANDQITASTTYRTSTFPHYARLNRQTASKYNVGGWAPASTSNQWLQVDMRKIVYIHAIATQGIHKYPYFVQTYTLKYSNDGNVFHDYQDANVLYGNKDSDSIVKNNLKSPIEARFIRVYPKIFSGWVGLRIELYGCEKAT